MSKLTVFTLAVTFILTVTMFFILLYFQVKITSSKNGTALVTSQATFFISADNPTKIITFPTKPDVLTEKLTAITSQYNPTTFGIFVKNLTTNQIVEINADETFEAASLYKIGLMYVIFQKGSQGKLNINDQMVQHNLNDMITISSNDAAYSLIDTYSSWEELDKIMHSFGLTHSDFKATPPTTTPRDIGLLLEQMADGNTINQETSIKMLELLNKQRINDRIPVLLPDGVVIAHKTGELDDARHDVGIIGDDDNDFVIVVMTKGTANPDTIKPVMSQIAKTVYDYFHNEWQNIPEIL